MHPTNINYRKVQARESTLEVRTVQNSAKNLQLFKILKIEMKIFGIFLLVATYAAEITNIDGVTEITIFMDALVTVELSVGLENEWLLRASSYIRSSNGIGG